MISIKSLRNLIIGDNGAYLRIRAINIIIIIYITEIISFNIRAYIGFLKQYGGICTTILGIGWVIPASFQLFINGTGALLYFIIYERHQIPNITLLFILLLVAANAAQSVFSTEYKIIQLFINLFGYYCIAKFWSWIRWLKDHTFHVNLDFIKLLHAMLTFMVIFAYLVQDLLCQDVNLSTLAVIEIQLEMLLLGYVFGTMIEREVEPEPEPRPSMNEGNVEFRDSSGVV